MKYQALAAFAVALACLSMPAAAQDTSLSFFITSVGSGDGANLGGLDGADAHCQKLAATAGAGSKTWRGLPQCEGRECA